jgi:hypothetical protein
MLRSGLGPAAYRLAMPNAHSYQANRLSTLLLRRLVLVTSLVHSVDPPYAE